MERRQFLTGVGVVLTSAAGASGSVGAGGPPDDPPQGPPGDVPGDPPLVDVSVLEDQPAVVGAGNEIPVTLDVESLDSLTVEATGNYSESDGDLSVDGEDAAFGEAVEFDRADGELPVTVGTTPETVGELGLDITADGPGTPETVSTGPTAVKLPVEAGVVDGQPETVEAGEQIQVTLAVGNLETVTVEATGDYDASAADLTVDGDEATFGEPVTFDFLDGQLSVTVGTDEDTGGELGLSMTATGPGDDVTLSTGPTAVELPDEGDPGEQLWMSVTENLVYTSPTVVEGTVYAGDADGFVYAIDAGSGEQVWTVETGAAVWSAPQVVGGVVYVGSNDGNLYALDAETGAEVWAFDIGRRVESSPTVADGVVYVGSNDGTVYALDAETGAEIWTSAIGSLVGTSSPTVADGTVYIGTGFFGSGGLYALDADTGEQQWVLDGEVESSPTVADGVVYVGSSDGNLYALDGDTGEQQWAFDTGDSVESSPTVADGVVYVASDDGNLYALDTGTGEQEWVSGVGSSNVRSSPTVAGDTVYIGGGNDFDGNTNVYALDAETGSVAWTHETFSFSLVRSSPTVVDGTVYVGGSLNVVFAIDAGAVGDSDGSRVNLRTLGHHDT